MTAAANDNRPPEFDARVMAYMPGLRKLAARHVRNERREDLVVDTIMHALEKWRTFREDGAMWSWLAWTMRGIAANQAKMAMRSARRATVFSIDDYPNLATGSTQQMQAELSETLTALAGMKGGNVLVRRAMGDGLAEIGADMGITRERVRQIEVEARKRFVKVIRRRKVAA